MWRPYRYMSASTCQPLRTPCLLWCWSPLRYALADINLVLIFHNFVTECTSVSFSSTAERRTLIAGVLSDKAYIGKTRFPNSL